MSGGNSGRISPADVWEGKNAVTSVNEKGSSAGSDTGFAEGRSVWPVLFRGELALRLVL